MGGAASKDFVENGNRTAVAQELDELGGYDRPALAKNQSFTARLDWLGTQVGKTSEQMQAALSKDEQAGRKELEKEAKRRQLMALRRGQGDIQSNLQYVDFYIKHKQFERGPITTSASILRNSPAAAMAAEALEGLDPPSPKAEAARRTLEHVQTLQRLYSSKTAQPPTVPKVPPTLEPLNVGGGGFDVDGGVGGPKPPTPTGGGGGGGNSRWRQTVQHAKKTAFLAVNTYVAMNAKKKLGPARIEDLGLVAEQQLGDTVQKVIEEGERLAAAREKLPDMKAELENLRTEMRTLAEEQQVMEATAGDGDDDGDADDAATLESAGVIVRETSEGDGAEGEAAAAATAAAAAAAMRHPRQKASVPNKPRWHFGGGGGGGFTGAKPSPRLRDPPVTASTTSPTGPASTPLSPPANGTTSTSAPLPSATTTTALRPGTAAAAVGATPTGALTSARRRNHLLNNSLNTAPGQLTSAGSGGVGALVTHGSASLGVPGPGLARVGVTRASWSGGVGMSDMAAAAAMAHAASGAGGGGGSVSINGVGDLMSVPLAAQQQHGGPLRPTRPSAPGILRTPGVASAATTGWRSRSENAGGPGGGGAPGTPPGAGGRPSSPGRAILGGRPGSGSGMRPTLPRPNEPPRVLADAPSTPGEHRVGTMALRIASRVLLPARAAARHQLRALRDAETANVLRQQQLVQAIEENANILQTSSGLLNMYCNRANGRWVEQQQWSLPQVHEVTVPAVKRMAERYKEVVLRDIKEGRIAVQIHVDDDVLVSSRLGALPLWSVDPWQLLAVTHPARTEWTSHLVGLGLGVRQLLALATAVEALAGPEALGRMQVVLCCHEGQVDAVVRDLAARKLCRFHPDNVVILVQQRAHGHTYDRAKHCFVPVPEAPLRAAGSGYALLSLCWAGADSFRLGGADLTQRRPMERSTLDMFLEKGVNWLSSWRIRDLAHFSPDTCLNVEQLALSYALADSVDANMSMQVELVESLQGINRYGSGIVLALKERSAPTAPPPVATAATAPILRRNANNPHANPGSGSSHPQGAHHRPQTATHSHSHSSPQQSSQQHADDAAVTRTSSSGAAERPASAKPPSTPSTAAKPPSPPSSARPQTGPSPIQNRATHAAAHGSPASQSPQPPATPQSPQPPPSQPPQQPQRQYPLSAPSSPSMAAVGGGAGGGGVGMRPASPRAPRPSVDAGASGGGGGVGGGNGSSSAGNSRRSLPSGPGGARAGGIGSEGGPLPTCDIKWADVQTPALAAGLQQLVDATALVTGSQPRVAVSIKRYAYHLPSLKELLSGPSSFRPSVSVGEGGYLYVTFDASDITALPAARCVALSYTPRVSETPGGVGVGAAAGALGGSGGGASNGVNGSHNGMGPPPTHLPPVQATAAAAAAAAANGSPAVALTRAGSAGAGGGTTSTNAIAAAAAAAAAAAMQRGRLLTNDSDLDTLLWVLSDQDNHPAFRATVSATNSARSRVTSHAAGGVAGATGILVGGVGPASRPGGSVPQQNVIVVAVTDDAACPLAVRLAMAIMKPGADCLHVLTIAKDVSAMAVSAAKAVAERFESMAAATLGDVKSVVQVKRASIVEDIAAYAESVRAVLLVTGSINLSTSAAQGSSVVGSVALSLARDCGRPILVVKPNCRLAETAYEVGKKPCLRAALAAETSSRPMVRYVADHVLDGVRGDKLVLVRGRAFDKDMNELTSSRRILDHLAEEATNNRRFDSASVVRRMVPGSFEAENQRVADADLCHIIGVQVPECRGPLPSQVTQLLRTSRAAVLVYRTTNGKVSPVGNMELDGGGAA